MKSLFISLMTNLEDEVCRAADVRQSRPAPTLLRSGLPPNPERPALSTASFINQCKYKSGVKKVKANVS